MSDVRVCGRVYVEGVEQVERATGRARVGWATQVG
jgi:hypothetical protein